MTNLLTNDPPHFHSIAGELSRWSQGRQLELLDDATLQEYEDAWKRYQRLALAFHLQQKASPSFTTIQAAHQLELVIPVSLEETVVDYAEHTKTLAILGKSVNDAHQVRQDLTKQLDGLRQEHVRIWQSYIHSANSLNRLLLDSAKIEPEEVEYLQELATGLKWKAKSMRSEGRVLPVDMDGAERRLNASKEHLRSLQIKASEFERLADRYRRLQMLISQAKSDINRLKQ